MNIDKRKLEFQNVLREINACVFEEIDRWVRESFEAIRACGVPNLARATRPHPIFNRAETAASRQLFTAILLTSKTLLPCNLFFQSTNTRSLGY